MYSAKIKALHEEYSELIAFCRENHQVSFEMYINDTYKRTLLLSAASYFEVTISKAIHTFADTQSHQNSELVAFVDNKGISRQYHSYFDWDRNNANKFLGLFGDAFKQKVRTQIAEKDLVAAETAFMIIGRERNRLVHQNYIEAQINGTFDEIYTQYEKACNFVAFFVEILNS